MLRKLKQSSKMLALFLVFTLVFVAGCQSVSDVDFNTVLKNSLKTVSSEGKQSIEFKLDLDEEMIEELPEEEQEWIKLITHMKLQLDDVKAENNNNMSLKGKLEFTPETSIAFSLKMSETLAVLELEGAKQPFVLDMTEFTDTESAVAMSTESMTAWSHKLIDTVSEYVIGHMPNPDRMTVKQTQESINGETLSLTHAHVDLNGPELLVWVKKYVDALAADQAGLQKMIESVLELLAENPDFWAAAGIENPFESSMLDAPTLGETAKEAAAQIASMLADWQEELKVVNETDTEWSEGLSLAADVYVDSKLNIRKQFYELTYTPGEDLTEGSPFLGLTVIWSSESWNINGAVKAEAAAASESSVSFYDLSEMQGYQVLKHFDEQSLIYDWLKNKMHIGKQTINWYTFDYYNPAIVTPAGITLIPLRDTVDELGIELMYEPSVKSFSLLDEATGTTIVVKTGSDTAIINGKSVKWSFPVTIVDGTAYLPARDLATALGATIKWSEMYGEEKVFTFEREV